MVYLTISTGLGGGLVLDGKLFRGTYGSAGELGHTFITENDQITCGCGRTPLRRNDLFRHGHGQLR